MIKKNIRIKLTSSRTASKESFFESVLNDDADFFEDESGEENNDGTIELNSEGVLCVDDKRAVISYDESELTGMEGSTTEVGFDLDNAGLVTMMRHGTVSTVLVFEKGKRHICTYQTEYMPFEICVNTKDVQNTLLEDGKIELDYIIEIRGAQAERTLFTIEICEDAFVNFEK